MKKKMIMIYVAACIVVALVLVIFASIAGKDTPPRLELNGTELDLSDIKVSDLNEAGFWLEKNDNTLPGSNFKELLSYYWGDDRSVSMGGVSLLNSSSSKKAYVDCQVFEITAKSRDKEGNPTGLQVLYEGEEVFGKTKEQVIELFGEPYEEGVNDTLVYRSEKKKYKTTFKFDKETGQCYMLEIDRRESNLAR